MCAFTQILGEDLADTAVQMVEGGDLPSLNTGKITSHVSETHCFSAYCKALLVT